MHKSIFLISVDNPKLYSNFKKTVKKKINLKLLSKFEIPFSINKLNSVGIWGFNSTSENKKLWKKMKHGDIVLFLRNKKYFCSATIVDRSKNSNIAKNFWTGEIYGSNRNLLIFVENIQKINLDFNSTIPIFVNPTMPESYRFPMIKIDPSREKILYDAFGTLDKAIDFLCGKFKTESDYLYDDIKIEVVESMSKIRKGQEKFRNLILNNFYAKCAICKISEKDLLQASHIIPVSQKQFMGSIQNGICFCAMHHLMFDRGYFSFDDNFYVIIAESKFTSKFLLSDMKQFKTMNKPKKYPSVDFLRLHRARYEIS